MKRTLRADQAGTIEQLREAVGAGERRVVVQAPCGFGKTVVSGAIVESARAKGKRFLFTVPAISLIDQTVESFWAEGIRDIGVIQANHAMTDWSKPVQIASVPTLQKRGELPQADVVIVDECHKWFTFFEKWFMDERWKNIPIIGLSATPWTRGLGSYYGKLIVANTIGDMIKQGTLAPFTVYAPTHPDLTKVRTVAGDYVENDLFEVMGKKKLIADIADSWYKLGEDRPTIAFCVNRAHAELVANQFNEAGIPAGYMDCNTKLHERKEIRSQFLARKIKVVCNVDVIGLGVDWPEVSCLIYARPTKSEMRFVQNIGRGLRICGGKTDCIIIDHSDTHLRMGYVSDVHHDKLHDGRPQMNGVKPVQLPKECPNCHYLKAPRTAVCPKCQFKVEAHSRVEVQPGELKKFNGARGSPSAEKFPDREATLGQLEWYARYKGYKSGWAAMKYKSLYGKWPRGLDTSRSQIAPLPDLANWIRSQNIRWAKGRGKSGRHNSGGGGNNRGMLTDREQGYIDQVRERYAKAT